MARKSFRLSSSPGPPHRRVDTKTQCDGQPELDQAAPQQRAPVYFSHLFLATRGMMCAITLARSSSLPLPHAQVTPPGSLVRLMFRVSAAPPTNAPTGAVRRGECQSQLCICSKAAGNQVWTSWGPRMGVFRIQLEKISTNLSCS